MNKTDQMSKGNDELDLHSIVEFIYSGWKTIVLMAVIGGIVGVCTAFILPEKFRASATIVGGRVSESDIEAIALLVERMRAPTFYSSNTLANCEDEVGANATLSMVRMFDLNIPRDSSYVNITAKMKSRDAAISCLMSVLEDVRSNQKNLFDTLKSSLNRELQQLESELTKNELIRSEELQTYQGQLEEAQNDLVQVESFLQQFRLDQISKNNLAVNDDKFSASSLLVSIVTQKQSEASRLKDVILTLGARIRAKAGSPQTEQAISDLKSKTFKLREQLQSPLTREAIFATSIYSQENKVEPRRSIIAVGGIVLGCFAAILLLLLSRLLAEIRTKQAQSKII